MGSRRCDNLQNAARFLRPVPYQTMKQFSLLVRRTALLAAWAGSLAAAYYIGGRDGEAQGMEGTRDRIAVHSRFGDGPQGTKSGKFSPDGVAVDASAAAEDANNPATFGTAVNFAAKLANVQAMPPGVARNDAYFSLIKEWAAADGPAALAAAGAITEPKLRHELRESALRSWAAANPEAAWKFASENPNGDLPDNRMELVFEGLGRGNPARALAFFEGNGKAMEKFGERAAFVFDELYESGHHDILVAWAEKQPPGKVRDTGMNRIIDRWARYDPAAAREWMDRQTIGKDNLVPARIELAESWARVNPAAALQWTNNLPEGQRDPEYYSRIYGRWIQYDRNAAAKYLASQPPSPQLDRPIERYTYEVMRQNPADTMPWAESISDAKRRWEAVSRVASIWGRRDPAALQNYVTTSGFDDAQKQQLLKSLQPRK